MQPSMTFVLVRIMDMATKAIMEYSSDVDSAVSIYPSTLPQVPDTDISTAKAMAMAS